ncbi:MAG: hypothetical protein ABIO55_06135 [Ginsengibacter sp.]
MKKIIYSLLFTFSVIYLQAQKTYIWCGTLIDGISNDPKINMTIVIEGNKIVSVESGFKRTANDKIIDLKTKTVTPGWMICMCILAAKPILVNTLKNFN